MLPDVVRRDRSANDEIDACRVQAGYDRIHFTAYPQSSRVNKGYCTSTPTLEPTNLVFDYKGKKLRGVTIEFEITNELEANQVFYQEPTKIKTGTLSGVVDFSKFGAGNYPANSAIVDQNKKLDTHIAFSAGVEACSSGGWTIILAIAGISLCPFFATGRFKVKQSHTPAPPEQAPGPALPAPPLASRRMKALNTIFVRG